MDNFIQADIYTASQAIDGITGALTDYGITGFIISDSADFESFLADKNANWDYVDDELMGLSKVEPHITLYVHDNAQGAETLAAIRSLIESWKQNNSDGYYGNLRLELANVKEEDWANNWKKYFNPIEVGEKLLIRPSWRDDYDAGNRKVLNIDPGLAFGTGGHETTRLCLEMCEKYLKEGDSVLDVGCGSGILGIATLLLGADRAVGVDIDETAVRTAAENAEINGVADRFTAICGSFTDKVEGKYDIVLANIVADAIMFLSKGIKDFMKDDAVYIMSGIIDTRAEEVKASVSQYFDIIEEHLDNGWACFAARRAAVPCS